MRSLKVALVSVLLVVLGLFLTQPTHEAQAADACTITVSGTIATVNCAGVTVGTVKLPTVEVTSPPLPPVTNIVKVPVPGPTIRVPGPTQTVTVAGGTQIVPGPTKTVTVNPQPTSLPSPTGSPTETTTGQTTPDHAMIGPATPLSPKPRIIDFGDGKTTVVEAGIGVVATILLIGLLLGMYYAGYTFGFREADSKNAGFIRDVLDESKA